MIEATPQLFVDLTSRYETNALQKSDLEYAEYFLELFERFLIFEFTDIKRNQLNPKRYHGLCVRTSEGVYMNESDLIYFLQIKLNQIMKDFVNDELMVDSVYEHCYDKNKKILIPDFKTKNNRQEIESWVRDINRPIDHGVVLDCIPSNDYAAQHQYQQLYADRCIKDEHGHITSWQMPKITWEQVKPYIVNPKPQYNRVICPCGYCVSSHFCGPFSQCISQWRVRNLERNLENIYCISKTTSLIDHAQHGRYPKSVNDGMTGEFKYKFSKINDIYRFIEHIGMFIQSKKKWE